MVMHKSALRWLFEEYGTIEVNQTPVYGVKIDGLFQRFYQTEKETIANHLDDADLFQLFQAGELVSPVGRDLVFISSDRSNVGLRCVGGRWQMLFVQWIDYASDEPDQEDEDAWVPLPPWYTEPEIPSPHEEYESPFDNLWGNE